MYKPNIPEKNIMPTRKEMERSRIIAKLTRSCAYCGEKELHRRALHFECLVPMAQGEEVIPSNFRVSCTPCTNEKLEGNMTAKAFLKLKRKANKSEYARLNRLFHEWYPGATTLFPLLHHSHSLRLLHNAHLVTSWVSCACFTMCIRLPRYNYNARPLGGNYHSSRLGALALAYTIQPVSARGQAPS